MILCGDSVIWVKRSVQVVVTKLKTHNIKAECSLLSVSLSTRAFTDWRVWSSWYGKFVITGPKGSFASPVDTSTSVQYFAGMLWVRRILHLGRMYCHIHVFSQTNWILPVHHKFPKAYCITDSPKEDDAFQWSNQGFGHKLITLLSAYMSTFKNQYS